MTERFFDIDSIGYSPDDGGNIHITEAFDVPPQLDADGSRLALGTLELEAWSNSTVILDEVRFEYRTVSFWPLAVGAAVAASPQTAVDTGGQTGDSASTTRRGFLAAAAAAAAVAAGSGRARAAAGETNVAEFELVQNPQGVQFSVHDGLDGHFSADDTYYVSVDGSTRGRFDASEDEVFVLNPGVEGHVTLRSSAATGRIEALRARFADDTIAFSDIDAVGLPNGSQFSDLTEDSEVVLFDQDILVQPASQRDPSEVVLTIDGETIPHANEKPSEAGYWAAPNNQQLVYTTGPSAPSARTFDIEIGVGRFDRFRRSLLGGN